MVPTVTAYIYVYYTARQRDKANNKCGTKYVLYSACVLFKSHKFGIKCFLFICCYVLCYNGTLLILWQSWPRFHDKVACTHTGIQVPNVIKVRHGKRILNVMALTFFGKEVLHISGRFKFICIKMIQTCE